MKEASTRLDALWTWTGFSGASRNMSIDEALLNYSIRNDIPLILRFFGWRGPTVTFGYFQPYKALEKFNLVPKIREESIQVIRRPTGGGWVWHQDDYTFSIIISQKKIKKMSSYTDSYWQIHHVLKDALNQLKIRVTMCKKNYKKNSHACFSYPVLSDLMYQNQKVLGGAQLRRRGYVLYQGSMQLKELLIDRKDFIENVKDCVMKHFNLRFKYIDDLDSILEQDELNHLNGKYCSKEW